MQKASVRHGSILLLIILTITALLACNAQPDVIEVVVTATPDVPATVRAAVEATAEHSPSPTPSPVPATVPPTPTSTPMRPPPTSTPTPTPIPTPTMVSAPRVAPIPGDPDSLPWVADGLTFEEGWIYDNLRRMDPLLVEALMSRDWLLDEISQVEGLFISHISSLSSVGANLSGMIETVLRMPFTETIDRSDANLANMLVSLLRRAEDEESQRLHLEIFQSLISAPNVPSGAVTDADTLRITYQIAVFLVDGIYGRPASIPTNVTVIQEVVDLPVSGPTDVGIASREPEASLRRRMEDLKEVLAQLDAVLHGAPSDEPVTVLIMEGFSFGGSAAIPIEPSWDRVQQLNRIAYEYWDGIRLTSSGSDELPNRWLGPGAHVLTVQLAQGLDPQDLSSLWTSPDYPPSTFQPTVLECEGYDHPHRYQCAIIAGVGLLSQTYSILGEDAFLEALRIVREQSMMPLGPDGNIGFCDYLTIFTEGADEPVSTQVSEAVTRWKGEPHGCE